MATPEELRAQRMQEQYNQPVYGPRNPPTQAQPLPVWAQGDIGGPLYRVGTGLAGATAPAPNAMMAGRFGSAPADTATPAVVAPTTGAATTPAPATATTVPAAPRVTAAQLDTNPNIRNAQVEGNRVADIASLSPENQAVIAQDRANLKASVDALNKNFDKSNELMGRAGAMTQGPTYANQRGDYSMTGTSPDVIADAARRSYTGSGGVNFGFAPGEASARLAGYAAQDQATREATAQRRAAIQADVERIGLRNAMTQGTPQERRAARQQMEALDARMNLGTQQLGDTTRQRISTAGDIQRASLAAQASQAAAMADAQAKQEAAQLTGEYGLAAAREKAAGATQAELTKAASPQGVLAAQRAALIQQQMLLAQQAAAAGDVSGTYAAYGLSRPNEKVYTDPVTGAPLSAEQIAIIQQQQLQRLQQTQ